MSNIQIERREFLGSVAALAGAIALPPLPATEDPWHSEFTLAFEGCERRFVIHTWEDLSADVWVDGELVVPRRSDVTEWFTTKDTEKLYSLEFRVRAKNEIQIGHMMFGATIESYRTIWLGASDPAATGLLDIVPPPEPRDATVILLGDHK